MLLPCAGVLLSDAPLLLTAILGLLGCHVTPARVIVCGSDFGDHPPPAAISNQQIAPKKI